LTQSFYFLEVRAAGKSPNKSQQSIVHAPDGVEFHRNRPRYVQCKHQGMQTDDEAFRKDFGICIAADTHKEHIPENCVDNLDKISKERIVKTDQIQSKKVSTDSRKSPVKRVTDRKLIMEDKSTDPNCPPGHVAMKEVDKLEMLRKLQYSYNTNLGELNKLPICVDTLRVRSKRIELEKQLQTIEKNIKVFSKSVVYVPLEV